MSWVGKDVARVDGVEKVTGAAKYVGDLKLPRMLHAEVIRSPYAHALITEVDLSAALRVPGVKAAVCGKDFPSQHVGIYLQDQTVFATQRVRYVGDPVAALAAESPEAALEAAQQVRVEYQPLDPVFDVSQGTLLLRLETRRP